MTDLSTDTGTGIFGPTHSYPFTIDFVAGTGLSGVKVANQIFPLQDSLFIDMGLSSVSPGLSAVSNPTFGVERTWTFNITAAVCIHLSSTPHLKSSASVSRSQKRRCKELIPFSLTPSSLHPIPMLRNLSQQPSQYLCSKLAPSVHVWTTRPLCS